MLNEDNPRVREAARYLGALHTRLGADERVELRHKAAGGGPMRREFVPTVEEAARLAIYLGEAHEVYAGAATRRGEDGTKKGVCSVPALWADLDAKDGHTREGRLRRLLDLPCHPSMLVWTGGGWHAFWLLAKPAESTEEMDQAESVMRRLAAGLDSDPVHDRSRIMRVPGTRNHKYGEPRLVVMERHRPDRRYDLSRLDDMAASLPAGADGDGDADAKVPREVLRGHIGEGARNVALASVAGSLRDRGLDAETLLTVLIEVNRLRCVPPLGDAEVVRIARSVGRYPAGKPRYRRSPVRRVRTEKKER